MDAQNLHHRAGLASWCPYLTCHQIWMLSMLGAGPVKFKLLICFIMFITFVMISNYKIDSICCELKEVKVFKGVKLNCSFSTSHDSTLTGIIIDTKIKYRHKTKLVSTLIK